MRLFKANRYLSGWKSGAELPLESPTAANGQRESSTDQPRHSVSTVGWGIRCCVSAQCSYR